MLCAQFGMSLALSARLVLDLRIRIDDDDIKYDEDGNNDYDDYNTDYGNGVPWY